MIYPVTAGGSITPSRFVYASTTVDNQVLQAGANAKVIGISQKGTWSVPVLGIDDGYAALSGMNLNVYGPPEVCGLELGGTVAAGDYLESDSSGRGVTSSTDGHYYGAIATQAGVLGQIIDVQVQLGMRGA
jgi:hypothetical protein